MGITRRDFKGGGAPVRARRGGRGVAIDRQKMTMTPFLHFAHDTGIGEGIHRFSK